MYLLYNNVAATLIIHNRLDHAKKGDVVTVTNHCPPAEVLSC